MEEELKKKSAGGKGGGGGADIASGAGGAISGITQSLMSIYMAEQAKKEKEKQYRAALEEMSNKNAIHGADLGAESELHNTGMMGKYFLNTLLGGR